MDLSCDDKNDVILSQPPVNASANFQKKFTLSKHEKQESGLHTSLGVSDLYQHSLGNEHQVFLTNRLRLISYIIVTVSVCDWRLLLKEHLYFKFIRGANPRTIFTTDYSFFYFSKKFRRNGEG